MEVRARYTLIGLFTVGIVALGLTFVYWLHAGGGIGDRFAIKIEFPGTVSGLLRGSAVHFNGVRVGEVTKLSLVDGQPDGVIVDIAIERSTPVRSDSRVSIDFQGLTGAPVVTLAGGDRSKPLLRDVGGAAPILLADKNAGIGMAQAARDVLRNIDRVVVDNAEPLKGLIGNLEKFAAALGRNSDRVDGLVTGLEKFTGASKPPVKLYDLAPASVVPPAPKRIAGSLLISEPTGLTAFDNDKLALKAGTGNRPVLEDAQWPDLLPKLIQTRLVQSFENAKIDGVIGRAPEGFKAGRQLSTDIRAFHVVPGPDATAEVQIAAKLIGADGRILASRVFEARVPIPAFSSASAATALSAAFSQVAGEIVVWVLDAP